MLRKAAAGAVRGSIALRTSTANCARASERLSRHSRFEHIGDGLANAAKYRPPFWRTLLLPYGERLLFGAAAALVAVHRILAQAAQWRHGRGRRRGRDCGSGAQPHDSVHRRSLRCAAGAVRDADVAHVVHRLLLSPRRARRAYTQGPMHLYSGKILVRKVASLWHAALANPAGSVVLWLDMDVAVLASLRARLLALDGRVRRRLPPLPHARAPLQPEDRSAGGAPKTHPAHR